MIVTPTTVRRSAATLALALGAVSGATAQLPLPAEPSVWVATMDVVAPTTGSGRCALFVTRSGHHAAVHCALEGVAPTSATFLADRLGLTGQVHASAPVSGGSTATATLDMPPASFIDALPSDTATIELHDSSGLLMRGVFSVGDATWTRVTLDGAQVVPPSSSGAAGNCDVAVIETPALVGVDCVLTGSAADTISLNAGGTGQTGGTLGEFAVTAGDSRPTVWATASGNLVQTARSEAPYYVEIGSGADAIRGQADGCRRDKHTLCLLDRFEVSAEGELGTDSTRGVGEAEPISTQLGLLRMRGTDKSGVQINTLSGVTAYMKDSCNALPAFTLILTLNAGTTSVLVRDLQTAFSRAFTLDDTTLTLLDQTTFACD